jgi:hypothetical protein
VRLKTIDGMSRYLTNWLNRNDKDIIHANARRASKRADEYPEPEGRPIPTI